MKITQEILEAMGFVPGTGFGQVVYVYDGLFWVYMNESEAARSTVKRAGDSGDEDCVIAGDIDLGELVSKLIRASNINVLGQNMEGIC